jgi:thioesterase domain-containing protein
VVRRVDGRLVAQVQPAAGFHLAVEDLVVPPGAAWRDRLADRSQQERALPFDLERDLMLRARLIRVAPNLHALVVTMHHIAGDGWSIAVLSRELKEFYRLYRTSADAARPMPAPLPYRYADFAHNVQLWLDSADAEPDIDYWLNRLADLPDVRLLPPDNGAPTGRGQRSDSVRSPLDGPAAEALRRLCRREGVTLFMLMEAAFAVLWTRRGAGPDVVFGTVAANRSPAEFDELIGMFVNTLAVRVAPGPDETFPDLLARVRLQTLEDLDHQHVPFDVLVKRLNPKRSAGETPLFQAMLVVQNNESMILELDGLDVTALDLPDHAAMAKVDVLLEVLEQGEEILLRWTYNADLFHRRTIAELAEQFTRLLAELAAARPTRVPGPGPRARTVGLFPLRQNAGDTAAIFALPGGLGLGSSFVQLSSHFTDRSFNALHTRELIDSGGSDLTLDLLVDSCVRTITGAGEGPIHLAGHSIGGSLAFHLVDALRRGGREVLGLVLLDPPAPTGLTSLLAGTRRDHLWTFLGLLAESFPDAARRWREQALDQDTATEQAVLLRAEQLLGRAELDLLDGSLTRAFDNYVAMLGLRWPEPEPIACPTLLLTATAERHETTADRGSGWERCLLPGCLVRQDVPTSHEGILRNPAAELVAALMSRFMLTHEVGRRADGSRVGRS